jgi:hypothetical protein
MMIALEVFAVLLVLSLVGGVVMEHLGFKHKRAHKGDAVKTPEEIASHQTRG